MAIDHDEVFNRFRYHRPSTEDTFLKHEAIRTRCELLAAALLEICPESRELNLALTSLDQVCMWANAAVARHQ